MKLAALLAVGVFVLAACAEDESDEAPSCSFPSAGPCPPGCATIEKDAYDPAAKCTSPRMFGCVDRGTTKADLRCFVYEPEGWIVQGSTSDETLPGFVPCGPDQGFVSAQEAGRCP